MLNRSKAAPVDGAVFVAICVIVKSFSLLTRKDLLYDFFCCFLKLRSSLGCLDRRWAEGAVCGSPSFCVTSELVKGAPSVCVQHSRPGCVSQDGAAWAPCSALSPSPLSPSLPPAWGCPPPAPWWGWNLGPQEPPWALHVSLKKYRAEKWGRFTLCFGRIIFFPVSLLKND